MNAPTQPSSNEMSPAQLAQYLRACAALGSDSDGKACTIATSRAYEIAIELDRLQQDAAHDASARDVLTGEIARLQSVYQSAVGGRQDFRESYRQARDLLNLFVAAWEKGGENMDRLCELARSGDSFEERVKNPPRQEQMAPHYVCGCGGELWILCNNGDCICADCRCAQARIIVNELAPVTKQRT